MKKVYFQINDGKASALLIMLSEKSRKNSRWIPMGLENLQGIKDLIVMGHYSSESPNIELIKDKLNSNPNASIYFVSDNIKKKLKNYLETECENLKVIGLTDNYNILEKEILGELSK